MMRGRSEGSGRAGLRQERRLSRQPTRTLEPVGGSDMGMGGRVEGRRRFAMEESVSIPVEKLQGSGGKVEGGR
jgi:hypothetical protein